MGNSSRSPETKEIVTKERRDTQTVLTENDQAIKKLVLNVKKEKSWKVGFGTTEAKYPDGKMNISTTGVKVQNKTKNLEATFGVANISQQEKPGEFPKNSAGAGISLTWKF